MRMSVDDEVVSPGGNEGIQKIGFMDKLRLRKSPQYLKILGAIDGRKNLEDISMETGLEIQSFVESITKLITEGYITTESE